MVDIPVKKYRSRRLRKWLQRKLVPSRSRANKVVRKWQKPDTIDWPPQARADRSGIAQYEYSWLSQNGEDGILRYLFEKIGFESKYFVEFGFHARQCNILRLMMHDGCKGIVMDGAAENVDIFNFAADKLGIEGVKAIKAFITRDNLQELIRGNGAPEQIDFLSLDVDGNDYWFWEELECVSPRVVCIEYNSGVGPEEAWTVPYDPEFERYAKHPGGFFYGASLAALESLGKRKGYRLIGCDTTGTNAFFLRDDVELPDMPTLTAREAFRPHRNWLSRGISEAQQFEIMKSLPFEKVP
jgi:hypothetical protein